LRRLFFAFGNQSTQSANSTESNRTKVRVPRGPTVLCTQPLNIIADWKVVIDAYSRSLKVTFISAIAVFVVVNVLVVAIDLPNLRRKEQTEGEIDDGEINN
jgi:hypothetical protein